MLILKILAAFSSISYFLLRNKCEKQIYDSSKDQNIKFSIFSQFFYIDYVSYKLNYSTFSPKIDNHCRHIHQNSIGNIFSVALHHQQFVIQHYLPPVRSNTRSLFCCQNFSVLITWNLELTMTEVNILLYFVLCYGRFIKCIFYDSRLPEKMILFSSSQNIDRKVRNQFMKRFA